MLRREALIDELAARTADTGEPSTEGDGGEPPRRGRRRTRARGGNAKPDAVAEERPPGAAEAEPSGEPVTGILDIVPAGHGFLRLQGLEPNPDDVYVSASQIRRCELRAGDRVEGPGRSPRRGERYHALVRVERVNGAEPEIDRRAGFEDLTPVAPRRRISLAPDPDDVLVRAVDLLVPLAYGQRVLVLAEPRSGRTTLLRGLVRAIAASPESAGVVVLLVDERPEEVTEWKRQAGDAEIAAAAADLDAEDQVRHAELALARAKRRAESGEDVVVIIDSLTRLGVAYRDPIAVKPAFGAGRELEEDRAGSLTVVATVLRGIEDGEGVLEAVETTESATIALDGELAAAGIVPAIDPDRCRVVGEESIRDSSELEAVRRLREELRRVDRRAAAELLAERISSSANYAELLSSL
jgi:transcription termination factor Rho